MRGRRALAAVAVVVVGTAGVTVTRQLGEPSEPCPHQIELPDVGRGAGEVSDLVDGCVQQRKVTGDDAYAEVVDDLDELGWAVDDLGYAATASLDDGDRRWTILVLPTDGGAEVSLSLGLETTVDEQVGYALGQPRLRGDLVLVPAEDGVLALDVTAGDERWQADECPGATWATGVEGPPAPVEVVHCGQDLAGIRVEDGSVAWRAQAVEAERVRSGTRALLLMGDRQVLALDLLTGEKLWLRSSADANVGSDDERAYVSTNTETRALDLDTGDEVWQRPLGASSLGVGDGTLVVRSNNWVVHRLDPASGDDTWAGESDSPDLSWSEVVGITEDVAVLMSTRGRRGVSAYSMGDGERLWKAEIGEDEPAMASAGGDVVGVWRGSRSVVELRESTTGSHLADLPLAGGVASIDGERAAFLQYGERSVRVVVVELP